MNLNEATALVASVPHWHHKFEIYPGVVTPGAYEPGFLLDKTGLPDDLSGLRVLDIGTSDGFFSLHLAKRGAQVAAAGAGHADLARPVGRRGSSARAALAPPRGVGVRHRPRG